MIKKHIILLGCFFLFTTAVSAQQSAVYTNDFAAFQNALTLFQNKQYSAAQSQFLKIERATTNESIKADCAYYAANAAVRMNQQGAEQMMEDFVKNYPTSTKRNNAFMEVGTYYFEMGRYPQAMKWFDKVDESNLSFAERDSFYFQKGYTYFQNKRTTEAKKYFNRITTSKEYGAQAKYYLGYMAYEGDDYQQATQYFEGVTGDERLSENLSYFQADMNFKLGNFEEAIRLGKDQFGKSNAQEKSQLSKIIGESYFNLGQYEAAIPYLSEYKGLRGRWNNTDYYQLGYAYYMQKDYVNAISEFNKIIDGRNAVAQNAYYHLGDSYLKQNKKQQALNAFKNASEMSFSAQIQEDAFYNYAKLSYEIGNAYTSVPQVLTAFLEKYPQTNNKTEIEDLLIDSYITSKNYKAALDLLENNKNFNNKLAFQKVAFLRGLELYDERDYSQAKAHFEKSLKEPRDVKYTARATFWKAESDYHLNNFEQALIGFRQFQQLPENKNTPESRNSSYHLAYTQFKIKNYAEAISGFQNFLAQPGIDPVRQKDANLRLADSYFVSSQYWPAMESYNKVIAAGGAEADYAAFQKAISYGFVDRTATKLEELTAFDRNFPNSSYRDVALYELGNTHLAQNKNTEAITAYDKLINNLPRSSYVPKALLKKGLILNNTEKLEQSLTVFKKVANHYPSSPEAIQAVSSAKLIYIDLGKVDEYARWVQTLDFVEVADAELDQASFTAAENKYLQNDPQAVSLLVKYISDFPNGIHSLPANFYLAERYFSGNQKDKAIASYTFVISRERNEYTEQALVRVTQIYLEKNDYSKALPLLERLEKEGTKTQNIIYAQSNLMKAYYEAKNYGQAVVFAEKVLKDASSDPRAKNDAHSIIARSAIKTGDEAKAKNAYAEVLKTASGSLAAEALYYQAYFENKSGSYQQSNATVQKLAKDYSGFKNWGGKGLILMAKNFYALKDAFQATYILESVIKNFADFPEIVEEATTELNKIKAQEAKTNASVETGEN
ncbi:MAG: tetratricopeptide repeat protein [Flavobacteriaceae bacterium]|nr:tetratricopeptide repeat protein [Flavobacteriaceae bacterium]